MPILRIEHAVPDFNGWKRAFDSDPVDRKGSGFADIESCNRSTIRTT
jgi:hypothetical protein